MHYDIERFNGSEWEHVCTYYNVQQAQDCAIAFNARTGGSNYRVRVYRRPE